MDNSCLLADDPGDGSLPLGVAQFAQLLGLQCGVLCRGGLLDVSSSRQNGTLVAMSYRTLRSLSTLLANRLRTLVRAGASLYIRGGFPRGEQCLLAPLVSASFSYVPGRVAQTYRIEANPLVPAVLRGEVASGSFQLPSARGISEQIRPLATARFEAAEWAPFLFGVKCGAGVIICDLLPDSALQSPNEPIVDRLADPAKRCADLGALVAARLGARIDPEARAGLSLVVDDRPANFDYLNASNLRRWLSRAESKFPGAHVDFAWTPDQLRPANSYVDTLKRFNTGIIWHGFKHHINYRHATNLRDDLRDGMQMVADISRRYQVTFQQVMAFPFEAFGLNALPVLQEGGFIATFANQLAAVGLWSPFPSFMDYSTPMHEQFVNIFPVLRRRSCKSLSRDVMLAHAALNLPIVTVLHPDELGLRRWPYSPLSQGSIEHCDKVLDFAAAKHLLPQSVEEVARDVSARPRPQLLEQKELDRINAL